MQSTVFGPFTQFDFQGFFKFGLTLGRMTQKANLTALILGQLKR